MVQHLYKKLLTLDIGCVVVLSVPKVDRGPLDTKNIVSKILEYQNCVFIGKAKELVSTVCTSEMKDNIAEAIVTLRKAVAKQSLFGR